MRAAMASSKEHGDSKNSSSLRTKCKDNRLVLALLLYGDLHHVMEVRRTNFERG
jgi:hypothetical protein